MGFFSRRTKKTPASRQPPAARLVEPNAAGADDVPVATGVFVEPKPEKVTPRSWGVMVAWPEVVSMEELEVTVPKICDVLIEEFGRWELAGWLPSIEWKNPGFRMVIGMALGLIRRGEAVVAHGLPQKRAEDVAARLIEEAGVVAAAEADGAGPGPDCPDSATEEERARARALLAPLAINLDAANLDAEAGDSGAGPYRLGAAAAPTDAAEKLATGHGGWAQVMAHYVGLPGKVVKVFKSGDVVLQFADRQRFRFGPRALESRDQLPRDFRQGDVVTVIDDAGKLEGLQKRRCGFDVRIPRVRGQTGTVTRVDPDGDVVVNYDQSQTIIFSPCCLELAEMPEDQAATRATGCGAAGAGAVALPGMTGTGALSGVAQRPSSVLAAADANRPATSDQRPSDAARPISDPVGSDPVGSHHGPGPPHRDEPSHDYTSLAQEFENGSLTRRVFEDRVLELRRRGIRPSPSSDIATLPEFYWQHARTGDQHGPCDLSALVEAFLGRKTTDSSLIWAVGLTREWTPISRVPAVHSYLIAQSVTRPPPLRPAPARPPPPPSSRPPPPEPLATPPAVTHRVHASQPQPPPPRLLNSPSPNGPRPRPPPPPRVEQVAPDSGQRQRLLRPSPGPDSGTPEERPTSQTSSSPKRVTPPPPPRVSHIHDPVAASSVTQADATLPVWKYQTKNFPTGYLGAALSAGPTQGAAANLGIYGSMEMFFARCDESGWLAVCGVERANSVTVGWLPASVASCVDTIVQCPVCFDDFLKQELTSFAYYEGGKVFDCNHAVCGACFKNFLVAASHGTKEDEGPLEKTGRLTCPIGGCEHEISDQVARPPLSKAEWTKFEAARARGLSKRCLTCRMCGNVSEKLEAEQARCQYQVSPGKLCDNVFCPRCGLDPHPGMTCEQAQDAETDKDEYLRRLTWVVCPKCKQRSQRQDESACDKATCACGHVFCVECLVDYEHIIQTSNASHLPTCKHYREDVDDPVTNLIEILNAQKIEFTDEQAAAAVKKHNNNVSAAYADFVTR